MTLAAELERAAQEYIERGLRVIALTGKAPNGRVHQHGLKEPFWYQYRDPAALRAAFSHPATTGVGILTGYPYYVVDIDGEVGAAQWKELAQHNFMPDRWVARTGRGLHLWVAHWDHFPTAKLGPKLDFKGEGGYVAAPPSLHPDGHRYEWLKAPHDATLPMEMPDELLTILMRLRVEREAQMVNRQVLRVRSPQSLHEGRFYPVATFEGIVKRVREEPEGNRNAVLYWAARTMLEEGADPEDIEELLDAAVASGLTRRESRRTIRSAIEALGG